MEITPIDTKETRRQTGDQSWPRNAEGLIGKKISGHALNLKGIIQRGMACNDIEEANRICDAIITTAEQVEHLEQAPFEIGRASGRERVFRAG